MSDPVNVRFATMPAEIEDTATGERHRESFALVIGADGLRSGVRRMVFGPHEALGTLNEDSAPVQ
jgi:2-polyprenyl-6-methoxyphenol hydroxylase-like FAD-dependent oxidoreductase